jgi:hypothetical protein
MPTAVISWTFKTSVDIIKSASKIMVPQSFNVACCFFLQVLHPKEDPGTPSILEIEMKMKECE